MTNDHMVALYNLATIENALFGSSYMNGFFQRKEDRDLMEFLIDLEYFYKRGFAHEITYRQATPLLYELYQDMISMKQGSTLESNLYFAHSKSIMPLTTLLGIFEQNPWIDADSYIFAKNRDWRLSSNFPFSGNFAILVYKNEENTLVQFAVNEHLVNLPGHFHTIQIEDAIEFFEKLIQVWIDDDDKCTPNSEDYLVNKLD